MPQTRRCAFQLHLALHEKGVFPHQAHYGAHPHTALTHRACEILSVPPDNKPTLARSALLSWLCCHLPRQWRLGARDFWFAGSRFRAFPHHKFEANFPSLLLVILIYTFTLTPNSTNTGVSRHHPLNVIYLRRDLRPGCPTPAPPREGTVGPGSGLSPIVNYTGV